jgi:hypothetical protein
MVAATNTFFQGMFFNAAFNAGLIGLIALLSAGLLAAIWGGLPSRAPEGWRGWIAAPMGLGLAMIVLAVLSARVAAGNVIQPFIYFQF